MSSREPPFNLTNPAASPFNILADESLSRTPTPPMAPSLQLPTPLSTSHAKLDEFNTLVVELEAITTFNWEEIRSGLSASSQRLKLTPGVPQSHLQIIHNTIEGLRIILAEIALKKEVLMNLCAEIVFSGDDLRALRDELDPPAFQIIEVYHREINSTGEPFLDKAFEPFGSKTRQGQEVMQLLLWLLHFLYPCQDRLKAWVPVLLRYLNYPQHLIDVNVGEEDLPLSKMASLSQICASAPPSTPTGPVPSPDADREADDPLNKTVLMEDKAADPMPVSTDPSGTPSSELILPGATNSAPPSPPRPANDPPLSIPPPPSNFPPDAATTSNASQNSQKELPTSTPPPANGSTPAEGSEAKPCAEPSVKPATKPTKLPNWVAINKLWLRLRFLGEAYDRLAPSKSPGWISPQEHDHIIDKLNELRLHLFNDRPDPTEIQLKPEYQQFFSEMLNWISNAGWHSIARMDIDIDPNYVTPRELNKYSFRNLLINGFADLQHFPVQGDGNCFYRAIIKNYWPLIGRDLEDRYSLVLRQQLNTDTLAESTAENAPKPETQAEKEPPTAEKEAAADPNPSAPVEEVKSLPAAPSVADPQPEANSSTAEKDSMEVDIPPVPSASLATQQSLASQMELVLPSESLPPASAAPLLLPVSDDESSTVVCNSSVSTNTPSPTSNTADPIDAPLPSSSAPVPPSAEHPKDEAPTAADPGTTTPALANKYSGWIIKGFNDAATMAQPGVWADHIQVIKASEFLQAPIWLYRFDDLNIRIPPEEKLQVPTPGPTYCLGTEFSAHNEPIRLFFTPETHYEVLTTEIEEGDYPALEDVETCFQDLKQQVQDLQAQNGDIPEDTRLVAQAIVRLRVLLEATLEAYREEVDRKQSFQHNDALTLRTKLLLVAQRIIEFSLFLISEIAGELEGMLRQQVIGPVGSFYAALIGPMLRERLAFVPQMGTVASQGELSDLIRHAHGSVFNLDRKTVVSQYYSQHYGVGYNPATAGQSSLSSITTQSNASTSSYFPSLGGSSSRANIASTSTAPGGAPSQGGPGPGKDPENKVSVEDWKRLGAIPTTTTTTTTTTSNRAKRDRDDDAGVEFLPFAKRSKPTPTHHVSQDEAEETEDDSSDAQDDYDSLNAFELDLRDLALQFKTGVDTSDLIWSMLSKQRAHVATSEPYNFRVRYGALPNNVHQIFDTLEAWLTNYPNPFSRQLEVELDRVDIDVHGTQFVDAASQRYQWKFTLASCEMSNATKELLCKLPNVELR